jgi:hypothetical protein
MLKYSSHAAYCALLYALLSRVQTAALQQPAEDEPSTLVWFFRAFVYSNITLLCAAVFVFDICGVRYSRLSDALAPPPLGLLLRGVFLYATALAANVSLCLVGMWAHRVVFGFPLRYELAGSVALLVAYNASNLWYNATASERLRPFWQESPNPNPNPNPDPDPDPDPNPSPSPDLDPNPSPSPSPNPNPYPYPYPKPKPKPGPGPEP